MNRIRVRVLPGLRRSQLSGLESRPAKVVVRRFHCGFPPHPYSLLATLATGQPPHVHGIFGGKTLNGSDVRLPDPEGGFELSLDERWMRVDAADEHSSGWSADLDADPTATWILIGAPTTSAARRFIGPETLLPKGARYRAEGDVLRVAEELSVDERDALLRVDGVERVLFGESLERRGLAHPEAGQSVVLASKGVSFREGDLVFACAEECWIAVLGEGAVDRCGHWPNAVHDLRIAPTIASWLGRALDRYADSPIRDR